MSTSKRHGLWLPLLVVSWRCGSDKVKHVAAIYYNLYLTHFPNLRLVPLDADLARETALVRAATGLRTPDAVQVAVLL